MIFLDFGVDTVFDFGVDSVFDFGVDLGVDTVFDVDSVFDFGIDTVFDLGVELVSVGFSLRIVSHIASFSFILFKRCCSYLVSPLKQQNTTRVMGVATSIYTFHNHHH